MLSETFHLIVKYDMDSYLKTLSLLEYERKKPNKNGYIDS